MTTTRIERPAPAVDHQAVAERTAAARSLLLAPLMTAQGPFAEELRLVRRHQSELVRLFAEGLGYRLVVEPGAARLFKAGLGRDSTRPLRKRSGALFAPRAYALLCLTIAALTRSKAQLLVDELVSQVRSAAADAEIAVDLDSAADRRALHAAFTVLVRLGVLSERDGDLDHWADQRTQSLLDVHREILSLLISAPLSSATSPEHLLDTAALPSAAGGARMAIRRTLVESPLLSVDDLDEEQGDWWRRNRNREREWFRDRFELDLELRAEGALAVDHEDELTDIVFPGKGATKHLALLLLEQLAGLAREGDHTCRSADHAEGTDEREVWRDIPDAAVRSAASEVLQRWREGLRRDQREGPEAAVREALDLLCQLGLLRHSDDAGLWAVHAAAARYATRTTLAEAAGGGERSLFDLNEEDQ
ncbi:MAG: TIGR02678 family protein [Dermatophilaceae bacterium]